MSFTLKKSEYIKYIGATYQNWWRAKVPMQAFEKQGYKVKYSTLLPLPLDQFGQPYKFGMPDIIVLNFVSDSMGLDVFDDNKYNVIQILTQYKALYNTKIVYDFDDNIFTNVKLHNDFNDKVNNIIAYLDFADVITVTTRALWKLLSEKEQEYHKPTGQWIGKTYVLPNCVPDDISCAPRATEANKGFIGRNRLVFPINGQYNQSESVYYWKLIGELSERNDILYIGAYNKGLSENIGAYRIPFDLTTDTYLDILKHASIAGFNGLIKLIRPDTTDFSIYKSNIKLLEAAIGGMGLLIDGYASPAVYDVKNLQHIEISDYSEPLIWIPAQQCRDVMEQYRIGKHIEKYIKAYGL